MKRSIVGLLALVIWSCAFSRTNAAVITFLDFEDRKLPTEHGWLPYGSPSGSVVQDMTNNGLSWVLKTSGSSMFGWICDLVPLGVDPKDSWVYSADLRQTYPDATIDVDSSYFHAHVEAHSGTPPTLRDNKWHHLEMGMGYNGSAPWQKVDGIDVPPPSGWPTNVPRHYIYSSDYYIATHFGNIGRSSTFYVDNIRFEGTLPRPPVPEPASLIVWSLLGASGIALGWWRRRRRAG